MDGTPALDAKRAVIERLRDAPQLDGVQVAYAWPGRDAQRDLVYGGGVRWTITSAGDDGARELWLQRNTIGIYVRVTEPGGAVQDVDARAEQLGLAVEEVLEADRQLVGGLTVAGISAGSADYVADDDNTTSILHYQVQVDCYVN